MIIWILFTWSWSTRYHYFQVIEFNINLFKDLTTFNMLDPSSIGGLSNVNFWAYKNVFTMAAWLVQLLAMLAVAGVYMIIRANLNAKVEPGFYRVYLDS